MQFTHQTCWFFIKEQLDSGCDLEVVELKHPPGKKGYVMIVDPGPDVSDIYIKLQIGSGTVIGRSFHYSTLPKRSNRNFGGN